MIIISRIVGLANRCLVGLRELRLTRNGLKSISFGSLIYSCPSYLVLPGNRRSGDLLHISWLSTSIESLQGSSHLRAQQVDILHPSKISGNIHVKLPMPKDFKAPRTNRPQSQPPPPSACPARHPSQSRHHPPSHPFPSRCPPLLQSHHSDPDLLT